MKNKKTIALAMAAVTVAPMAVPAFADEQSLADQTMDVMLANGYEIVTIGGTNLLTRAQVFDQNGTEYTSDDTIKTTLGEGAKVLAVKEEGSPYTDTTVLDDRYVVIRKASSHKVSEAKAKVEQANEEIAQLEKDGYIITTTNYAAKYNAAGTMYEPSKTVKTAKLDAVTKTFTFIGTENLKDDDTVANLKGLFSDFAPVLGEVSLDLSLSGEYQMINKMKYIIESNLSKFDIVKEETNPNTSGVNQDIQITIYKKGTKGVPAGKVITVTFQNFAKVDKNLIVNMPAKTDVDGHWAEADIKDAMLKGYVDASSTFRPKDGITRSEFAKMVCTVYGIDADAAVKNKKEEPFHDVTSSDWYYKYIVALYNYNPQNLSVVKAGSVINGYEDDLFKPNAKITREEAAKMVAAAYELRFDRAAHLDYDANGIDKGNGFDSALVGTGLVDGKVEVTRKLNGNDIHRDIKTKFVDDKDIASWADESVQFLGIHRNKIIDGYSDGTFRPKNEINRAEALVIIQRAVRL